MDAPAFDLKSTEKRVIIATRGRRRKFGATAVRGYQQNRRKNIVNKGARLRVVHVGSFRGNLGDRMSHKSFRSWFESLVTTEVMWKEIEIRDHYRGKIDLRDSLKENSEDADLIIAGGGGFWETWPENSEVGVSLDIPLQTIKELDKPVFFNALGVDSSKGISRRAREHFGDYVRELEADSNCLVSVRNDGSIQNLHNHFSRDFLPFQLSDHALLYDFGQQTELPRGRRPQIAVNLAIDMPEIRFPKITPGEFARRMAGSLDSVLDSTESELTFVPHIFSDLQVISQVLDLMADKNRRERCAVAPLDTGIRSPKHVVSTYRDADIVISSRFHSITSAFRNQKPTISISSTPKNLALIGEEERLPVSHLDAGQAHFVENLTANVSDYLKLSRTQGLSSSAIELAERRRREFEPTLVDFLKSALG